MSGKVLNISRLKIKDAKLDKPGYMKMVEHILGADEAKKKLAVELFNTCGNISDSDACEAAMKIGMCLKTEGEKNGIPLPIWSLQSEKPNLWSCEFLKKNINKLEFNPANKIT